MGFRCMVAKSRYGQPLSFTLKGSTRREALVTHSSARQTAAPRAPCLAAGVTPSVFNAIIPSKSGQIRGAPIRFQKGTLCHPRRRLNFNGHGDFYLIASKNGKTIRQAAFRGSLGEHRKWHLSYSPREGPGALNVPETKKNLAAAKKKLKGLEQRLERHEAAVEAVEHKRQPPKSRKRHRPWEL